MQQDRGEEAQYGEAEEYDNFGDVGVARGSDQGGQCADVPEEGETGGGEGQPASAKTGSGSVLEKQIKEYAENDGAGRVADGVDELSFVECGQFVGLRLLSSSVVRLFGSSVLYPVISWDAESL